MRRILVTLFAGIILNVGFPISNGIAQTAWESFGPFGGRVNVIAIDPTNSQTMYVGTNTSGVFKSIDGGKSWSGANTGIPSYKQYNGVTTNSITGIVVDHANSQNVYVKTLNNGVYKSSNAGTSWAAANAGIVIGPNPSHPGIGIDPANSQILYTGVDDKFYKTADGGSSWTIVNSEINKYGEISAIAIDPRNSQILYVGKSGGIFKSTDSGATWTEYKGGINVKTLAIDPKNSQIIYAGAIGSEGGGV